MGSDFTAVRARPYPASSDTPNVNGDIQALADSVSTAPNATGGLLSARPTTNLAVGDTYYATDGTAGQPCLFFYDGSAWLRTMVPAPWVTPAATSGLSSGIQVRLVGDQVCFRGGVQNVSGSAFSGTIIPALGSQYTVSSAAVLPPVSSDEGTGVVILEVASDTLIVRDGSIANGDFISLEGISYSLGI